jgi:general secretion pathway protein N
MAGREIEEPKRMRRPTLTLLLAAVGVSAPTSALPLDMPDIDADTPRRVEAPFAFPRLDSPRASAPAPAAVEPQDVERAPSGNPLWAIPLATFSATRERPIFSSSRRPPPPAVVPVPEVKAPPPPPESPPAERPQLSLVGTVASSDRSFGIFLDQATKSALRLKVGEDFQGWTLLSVLGREAIFERDRQTTILRLPQPDADADGQVRVQAGTEVTQGYLDFQPQRGGLR